MRHAHAIPRDRGAVGGNGNDAVDRDRSAGDARPDRRSSRFEVAGAGTDLAGEGEADAGRVVVSGHQGYSHHIQGVSDPRIGCIIE